MSHCPGCGTAIGSEEIGSHVLGCGFKGTRCEHHESRFSEGRTNPWDENAQIAILEGALSRIGANPGDAAKLFGALRQALRAKSQHPYKHKA